jgi:hypothetical protein
VFDRDTTGGLLADSEALGAGAPAGADGDAGATGVDAGADGGACTGNGAEVGPLLIGAGATACSGSAAALGASAGADLTAAQPPAARQHSAIAQRDVYKRPIIEFPANGVRFNLRCHQD